MTSSGNPQGSPGSTLSEGEIVAFLRANPAFLDAFPELLSELSIPHASGDAVSLLERQVGVLRDDNARLRVQLDELLQTAQHNESVNGRIHALVLALMNAVGPQAIFERLEHCLRDDFGADYVAARVFAEPAFADSDRVAQFVGQACAARQPFADILGNATTACGELTPAQCAVLFDDPSGAALSAVIMPLIGKNWDGVLVIASDDLNRYRADMGTEYLTYLKDVVALVIDPWVKRMHDK